MNLGLINQQKSAQFVAKVYRDAEWNEFRVKHFVFAQHQVNADYHCTDKQEALDRAVQFVRNGR